MLTKTHDECDRPAGQLLEVGIFEMVRKSGQHVFRRWLHSENPVPITRKRPYWITTPSYSHCHSCTPA